jgi:uncharacterized protein
MDETHNGGLAVVTGASSGIGLELAKVFAANGFDLIVTAEDADIHTVAEGLRASGVQAEAVQVDLGTETGVEELWGRMKLAARPFDAVALNAGVGAGGAFVENDLVDELRVIDLNVRSTVHLAKYVVQDMVDRGEGRILITSSVAAAMPGSFQAVYNASKSFLQSFTEALQEELEDTGITLTSLMPGPTETEFFERADMLDTNVGQSKKDSAAQVAEQGFEALMKGERKLVAGSLMTKAQGVANRVLPDSLKGKAHRAMAEPKE